QITLSGLARRLVQDGLISEAIARQAQEQALKRKTPFVTHLVENKILDSRSIAWAASQEFGVPLLDLNAMDLEQAPVKLVDEKLITQHHALPLFKRGKRLYVAVSDPTNLQALDEIKFHTGTNTEAILVEEDKLTRAIEKALEANAPSMGNLLDIDRENLDTSGGDDSAGPEVTEAD